MYEYGLVAQSKSRINAEEIAKITDTYATISGAVIVICVSYLLLCHPPSCFLI